MLFHLGCPFGGCSVMKGWGGVVDDGHPEELVFIEVEVCGEGNCEAS